MLNLVRRDFIVTYSNKSMFYLPPGMLLIFLLSIENFDGSMAFMVSVISFVFIGTRTPFTYEIQGKPHLFIQSLPVTKNDIVISKYIFLFINFLIGSIISIFYIYLFSLLGLIDMPNLNLGSLAMTLAASLVLLSISLPAEFSFTTKTANFVNLMIYIVLLNFFILQDGSLFRSIYLFSGYRIAIAFIVFLLYFLSMGASVLLYKNRKFY